MNKFNANEWEKLQGAKARTAFSISALQRICATGEVLSAYIVQPGKTRGYRLINKKSLDDYITSFMPGGSRHHEKVSRGPLFPKAKKEAVGA